MEDGLVALLVWQETNRWRAHHEKGSFLVSHFEKNWHKLQKPLLPLNKICFESDFLSKRRLLARLDNYKPEHNSFLFWDIERLKIVSWLFWNRFWCLPLPLLQHSVFIDDIIFFLCLLSEKDVSTTHSLHASTVFPKNWQPYPVLGVLVFLPRNFLDFWHFLPISWQLFLARFVSFARFFKIVERNPRKFLDFLARKPRLSKILARYPRKILDFLPRKFLDFWDFLPRSW